MLASKAHIKWRTGGHCPLHDEKRGAKVSLAPPHEKNREPNLE